MQRTTKRSRHDTQLPHHPPVMLRMQRNQKKVKGKIVNDGRGTLPV